MRELGNRTDGMTAALRRWAHDRGYRVAWGSAKVVLQAQLDIRERHSSQQLDQVLYDAELAAVAETEQPADAVSVVVVAMPRPAHRVAFELADGRFEALLPPTYFRYRPKFEEVRQDLACNGLPGSRIEHLTGPLKATAARLGLVRYGRNNLTYSPGFGSYQQLCGYFTDAELAVSNGTRQHEPSLLPECDGCDRCRAACPTNSISENQVLIHAEHCLTFANENPGTWPDWVPARAHSCLLGCLACQRSCPANPKLQVVDSGVTFSREESDALLNGRRTSLSEVNGIKNKLAWIGQPFAELLIGRNLRALVDKRVNRTYRNRD